MKTISVTELKAHLSAELRRVKSGEQIVVLEHRRPVAVLKPYTAQRLVVHEPREAYEPSELSPLTSVEPDSALGEERDERW